MREGRGGGGVAGGLRLLGGGILVDRCTTQEIFVLYLTRGASARKGGEGAGRADVTVGVHELLSGSPAEGWGWGMCRRDYLKQRLGLVSCYYTEAIDFIFFGRCGWGREEASCLSYSSGVAWSDCNRCVSVRPSSSSVLQVVTAVVAW